MRTTALSLIGGLMLFGCSATGGSQFTGAGGTGAGGTDLTGAGSGSGQGGINLAGSGSASGGAGCSDAAKLIYVLSQENDLYSFKPDLKQFKKIGPLQCQANGATPNSMAIDRNAVAWVNYVQGGLGTDTAGYIFKVSTVDASCQSTNIKLPPNWYRLGMGFASDVAGGMSETLYIDGTSPTIGMANGPGLGKIDFAANTVVPIGNFGGALTGQSCELTGTGDARLFGFFVFQGMPVQLAELNKGTGQAMSPVSFGQITDVAAWAFSFWGGDFYFYTAPADPFVTSTVTHYIPSTKTTDYSYMTNIGFRIVGAGVSTCAPTSPPK